ncbi:helix-turn-helix domain-containing protein [Mucilaginibacter ginsenosidivorans]|uniref:Helix-turn-helix domain-containing protein n=1 Tax=Mucilaginibacter ginsenosidivorans TaxID=398053 RepID=A0A5B8UU55_9SPHI|nr:helix-turn-helix domain-containing protein [Mucilaginibacter ginsenosidivorans]QEC62463.1 helix-turn-helix domain-containing protein [Mucilaginibacter ginsenosidivorans]
MSVELITKDDLQHFRLVLLNDIKELLAAKTEPSKEWLKGTEVRKLLKVSHGTLQNLRTSGRLYYSKIGGTYYYRYKEIMKMLESGVEAYR